MNDERHEHDTDAILRRRRFLIKSALTGAGLGALLTGCEPEAKPCLSVIDPKHVKPKTDAQPCLTPKPPEPKPRTDDRADVCLSLRPYKPPSKAAPEPCLSPPIEPRPCLKFVPPTRPPEARPCLSIRERD